MEQITMDLMAVEPEVISIANIDKALALPIACESCVNFVYIGWEADELKTAFGKTLETQIGICKVKNQKLFGSYVCDSFKGWPENNFEPIENREKPYALL